MRRQTISLNLPSGVTREKVEIKRKTIAEEGKKRGVEVNIANASDIYSAAINLYMGLSPQFIVLIERLSQQYKLPASVIVESFFLSAFADWRVKVEDDVMAPLPMKFKDDGPMQGDNLYASLFMIAKSTYEKLKPLNKQYYEDRQTILNQQLRAGGFDHDQEELLRREFDSMIDADPLLSEKTKRILKRDNARP